ncbi:serine hydrolase FSH [Annulohypoxylon maeteangense]|uniref:serine hydrolase FSH n=1 Tax=Annulohypoxylon maeteangense TaxID=1927788 RepID=UPI0020074520|nr:serine hydrolase FSH [Annulohypoxylon maeteangense]KAI0887633.1 serine hydrolase FSH [Annulohypoxylon maeteangense]
MRFICLHGMGTSADIFEIQTGPLRQALGKNHEFEFYEGEHEVPPAPGIHSVFERDIYKAWYDPCLGASTHRKAIELLSEIVDEDGPFDGCIGFSQGASLLGSFLLAHQSLNPFSPPPFRLAIFICGSSALSVSESNGLWSRINPQDLEGKNKRIKIPTVHIYGRKDPAYQDSLNLKDMCEPRNRLEYDHNSGHDIPRGVAVTKDMSRTVQKGIERAMCGH